MAILDILPGVEVAITVNGENLQEYTEPDAQEEERVVTKYIEAETGAQFAFKIKVPQGFQFKGDALSIICSADGSMISENTCIEEKSRGEEYGFLVDAIHSRDGSSKPLRFETLGILQGQHFTMLY